MYIFAMLEALPVIQLLKSSYNSLCMSHSYIMYNNILSSYIVRLTMQMVERCKFHSQGAKQGVR